MKRQILVVLVSILLGVLANVGTAWWCAYRLDPFQAQPGTWYRLDEGDWVRVRRWESLAVTLVCLRRIQDAGLRDLSDDASHGELPPWQLPRQFGLDRAVTDRCADGRGWPLLSMYSEWRGPSDPTDPTQQRVIRGGIEIAARRTPGGLDPIIPLRPIWPGFGVNSLVFATPFWLGLTVPYGVRRGVRRRRGECLECGYPVAMLPVCPECGAARGA